MSEAINAHKKMAMGITEGNKMKKGGKVAKYAKGGQVSFEGSKSKEPAEISHQKDVNKINAYPEKVVRNLPAKGIVTPYTKAQPHAIATMKSGGKAKGGIAVMIAVGKPMKKAAGRGR
jgi:hypothetical protein